MNCFVMAGLFVIPFFVFRYKRDFTQKNWARREAMLVIHEREELGLPYIQKNYVDPAKIQLPTDEELDGAEVII